MDFHRISLICHVLFIFFSSRNHEAQNRKINKHENWHVQRFNFQNGNCLIIVSLTLLLLVLPIVFSSSYTSYCTLFSNSTINERHYSANPRSRALAIRKRFMCTHARYCYWWAGPSIFIQLVVAYHLAESQSLACYTTR